MKSINDNAPVNSTGTILIQAKPERVWNVLTDINHWNSWQPNVSYAKLNGLLQADTTFDWKAAGIKIHSTLHTVEPFTHLGWTGNVFGIHAIHNWTFSEVNGVTEVRVSESMEGFLAKLFSKSLTRTLKKDMDSSLQLLKVACEK